MGYKNIYTYIIHKKNYVQLMDSLSLLFYAQLNQTTSIFYTSIDTNTGIYIVHFDHFPSHFFPLTNKFAAVYPCTNSNHYFCFGLSQYTFLKLNIS